MTGSGNFINGGWVETTRHFTVRHKYTGEPVREVGLADRDQASEAVRVAADTFASQSLTPYRRFEILSAAARLLDTRRERVLSDMLAETGFTRSDCLNDFNRALQTLTLSAEEAKRITGEMIPIQGAPGQRDERLAFTIRMPIGVVCAITPFNSPLNTVIHKVAPAIAAGNTVVLKPATYTPLCAIHVVEVLAEAGLPAGFLNLIHGDGRDVGSWLLEDQKIEYYTFTGSTRVGLAIQQAAGLRRTQLELGNISSTIVFEDAALEAAAEKCINASFRKAGQVCTSIQRILVHEQVIDRFAELMTTRAAKLKAGDPDDPETFVGPMIDEKEAVRAEAWISEAVAGGARLLLGGKREGALLHPTILRDVKPDMKVACDEIFAPVISLTPFTTEQEALGISNGTPFGLAVGFFTSDITRALRVVRRLRMGSIHVNDTSSSRVDLMPYGGLKESGFGHEGPRYAIRDMTEERLVTLNPV